MKKVRIETAENVSDLIMKACIKEFVIGPLTQALEKQFPGFASGGLVTPPGTCKHGQSLAGTCVYCNTETIDRLTSAPGTITIQVGTPKP